MKGKIYFSVLGVLSTLGLNTSAAGPKPYHYIQLGGQAQCLTAQSPVSNLSSVKVSPCKELPEQQWYQDALGRLHVKVAPDFCMEAGRNPTNNAAVFMWRCHQGTHQQWQLIDQQLQNRKNSQMVLDASASEPGKAITYTAHGGNNQHWQLLSAKPPVDFGQLQVRLDQANKLLKQVAIGVENNAYYPADVEEFSSLVEDVKQLTDNEAITQSTVDQAIKAIEEAIDLFSALKISHKKDLEALYRNVQQLEFNGNNISQLVAIDSQGFLVHAKKPQLGVGTIAAGRLGEGRVVVLGREIHAYLNAFTNPAAQPNMQQFTSNLLSWLTARHSQSYDTVLQSADQRLKVLVEWKNWRNQKFDETYQIDTTPITNITKQAALFDPAEFPVAIVNPRIESPEAQAVLEAYVNAGGSLLMGHQVWSWKANLKAAPGQQLLSKAGIAWNGGKSQVHLSHQIASKPDFDELIIANIHQRLALLKAIETGSALSSITNETLTQLTSGLSQTFQYLPESIVDTLLVETNTVLKYPLDRLNERPYTQLLAYADSTRKNLTTNQHAAIGHEVMGIIPPNADSMDKTLTFDFNQVHSDWVRTSRTAPYWLSTGLYAPAGEVIVINVTSPSDQTLEDGKPSQIEIRVNGHTDDIATKKNIKKWARPPKVSFTKKLNIGRNTINAPYGGLIYLTTSHKQYRQAQANITIKNAIKAPYFKLGEHTNSQWNSEIKHYPAPWGEIHSGNMIVLLSKQQLQQIEDVEAYAKAWQQLTNNTYQLMGLDKHKAIPHKTPTLPNRFHSDFNISLGSMHSGYPIMALVKSKFEDYNNVLSWGPFHELGHNYQQQDWMLPGTTEVTVNLFSLYQQEQFDQPSRLATQKTYDKVLKMLNEGKGWNDIKGPFERLVFYHQFALAYGWDFYTNLYSQTRNLYLQRGFAKAKSQLPADYLLIMGSRIAKEDLRRHFEKWQINVTDEAKQKVAEMKLPIPATPLWLYGTQQYPH
ncbi:M60 family metallopeptidase [Zooshikella ganghwensis]|uniref:M60 family metallopeptidase n=1 Tax=Zooshikella ganghwensis TaxID=202772 RepID=UPI00041CE05E|nr:M60 family metallopeptidase [Zooshikella ganghwensis]